jgi:hypothetical protein
MTINAPLAAALRDATPEQLRAWAKVALAEAREFPRDLGPSMTGLAALALAVADVMTLGAEPEVTVTIETDDRGTVLLGRLGQHRSAPTLPAALAALLEDA